MSYHKYHRGQLSWLFTLSKFIFITFLISGVAYSGPAYNISNTDEFIAFSKRVNNGESTFSGTTVLLTADIDFSSSNLNDFEPIRKNDTIGIFAGTFDGQGHIIKNLVMNSSDFRYTGLFGSSSGLMVKNVVIDESCSFTSYYSYSSDNDAFVSSVIGNCVAISGTPCEFENIVNMAAVSYLGRRRSYLLLGGIISKCIGNCILTNCVKFGSILISSGHQVITSILEGFSGKSAGGITTL